MMEWLSRTEGTLLLWVVAAYFVAMILLWAQLFFHADDSVEQPRPWRQAMGLSSRILLWTGVALHLLALTGQGGALFTLRAGVAGLFGFSLILVFLVAEARLGRAISGAFIVPVALIATLYSLTETPLHRAVPQPELLETQWLVVHVSMIVIAYVALAFAFVASLLYLLQEGLLKRKQLHGLWQRLPSLQVADTLIYRATGFGLALLSLGLFIGIVWQQRHQPDYPVLRDPKVLFSLLTWLTFAVYLSARRWLGWRGRRTNLVVVYGFVLMVISFFGMPHVIQ